ncbi:porin family protein [Treponema sp. OttesenSCG-928-L16]|nr:porin family protein [Treponema sp. OttesenSCG-928-L16]
MKKLICVLVLVLMAGAVSVFAIDLTSYPVGTEAGDFMINIGAGFGSVRDGNMMVPPLSASVDYNLPIAGLPFYVGGIFGFAMADRSAGGYDFTYTTFAFGGRFGYHFNWGVENLDTYAGVVLGYEMYRTKVEWSGNDESDSDGYFLWGVDIGVRYFFTPVIGVFAEVGYSALSFVKAGLALKF